MVVCDEVWAVDWNDVVEDACEVKSNLTFASVTVTDLVIEPKPGPEAVTLMDPDVPIGIA